MPSGVEIDYESRLRYTVPFHRRHIIVQEGRTDWPSRFEDDGKSYAAKVKEVFGKSGPLFDVCDLLLYNCASMNSLVVSKVRSHDSEQRYSNSHKWLAN